MKRILLIFLASALVLVSGCSQAPEAPLPESSSVQYATKEPDSLSAVVDLIYQDVDMKGLTDADSQALTALFHIEPDWVQQYAIRYSDGRYGVADVAILKPVPEHAEDVLTSLEARRSDRIAEFENYDVHDALNIAKTAEIFSRGDYVILLMLQDAETARLRIQEQIPG